MSGNDNHIRRTFQVLGMSCASCAGSVESTLAAQKGVHEAKVNIADSTAFVDYDSRVVTAEGLKKAVEGAGYDLVIDDTEDSG